MDQQTLRIKLEDCLQILRDEFRIGQWVPNGLPTGDLQIRAVQQACYEHMFRRFATEISDAVGQDLVPTVAPWKEPPPQRPSAYDVIMDSNVRQTEST